MLGSWHAGCEISPGVRLLSTKGMLKTRAIKAATENIFIGASQGSFTLTQEIGFDSNIYSQPALYCTHITPVRLLFQPGGYHSTISMFLNFLGFADEFEVNF